MEIQKFVQYTITQRATSIYFALIVGVKIVGRPDLADWKTKICLIIVPKHVEEKVSLNKNNLNHTFQFNTNDFSYIHSAPGTNKFVKINFCPSYLSK